MTRLDVRGAPPTLPVFARGATNLAGAAIRTAVRRARRGPRRPGWSFVYETAAEMLRSTGDAHVERAASHGTLPAIRRIFHSVELQRVFAGLRADCRRTEVAGIPGTWITPRGVRTERLVYYIHGGGYFFGSSGTHGAFLAELAHAARAEVFAVDYCLAPERRFPHALDEVLAAYLGLLDAGHDPRRMIVAGDSAGGAMTVATLVRVRDAGGALPSAAVLLSPWVDLTASIERADDHADWLPPELLPHVAAAYLGGVDPSHPLASPIRADLAGLPPMHVHAGGAEIFLPQIERFAARARASAVSVELTVEPHRIHVSHGLAPIVPESLRAIRDVGRRMRGRDQAARAPSTIATTPTSSDVADRPKRARYPASSTR